MINKAKRILAFFIVLVMLSGMIGTDNIMKLTIYAEDAVEQGSAEEQSGEGTASAEATPAPAETPVPVETPASVETAAPGPEPVVQGTENENVGTDTLPAEEETTGTESTADDSARQPVETKKPEKAKTPKEPYDHKVEKIKVIPDLEMSLSGILPDTVTVRFEKTKYEMEQDDKIILYMAEIHVYDESGKEFKSTGEITVELKGDLIRKAIEQEKTFGLIVNEKDKEAEFIKAKKDTMTFRIKEFDLFVLYELVPVIDTETETAASDGQPVQTEPATTETETGATETEQDVTETETDAAETETVVPEAENPVSETEEPEASPAPILSEEEAEENDGEEEPATEPASDAAEPENAEEDEAEEKELSYCFASTEDALMLLAFLTEHGFDFESIAEVQISEGEETSVEIEECEGDRKLIPTEHFDRLILNILIDEETSICVVLSYPSAELVENTLTPEIPGEATMTITGLIPEGSTAEATPVEVSIDGNDALAAYDIDIFAPDTESEEIWQPGEGETVTVEMYDPSFEGLLYVYHMEDENSEPELVACVEANDGEISFEAASFSVYVIVPAPDPIPGGGEIVQNPSELALNYSRKFKLSVTQNGSEQYFKNTLNGNGAFELGQETDAALWSFEPTGEENTYYISTVIGEETLYMFNTSGYLMALRQTEKSAFVAIQGTAGRLRLKLDSAGEYLQYSGRGKGIRLHEDVNNNGLIRFTYAENPGVEGDPYELDGVSYGLMHYSGETSAYAMMAETKAVGSDTHLASKSLLVRHDPMDQSGLLYVSKDSDATLWTFQWIEQDLYYLTAGNQYVRIQGGNITLVDEADAYCRIRVIPGTGDRAGKVRLLGIDSSRAIGLSSNASNGFGGSSNGGNREWLNLMQLSSVYGDADFVMYSAVKVGVSDTLNVTNGKQVVIYTRVWNEQSEAYEFYAIDHNGDLVPCYESGESIVWIGSQINTLLWNFTEYYYAGTTTPNYYYELQNNYTGKYLAPQISDGQIMSDSTIGVNLNGRRYGDYYSTILAWDDPHYDYAGLKTENGHIVSCPVAQAETFYFAVMQISEQELTEVETVDHQPLGLVMKMVDFNGTIVSGGSGNSPTTQEQLDVMGTRVYSEGNSQPGLLSTELVGGPSGYPTATKTQKSLSQLFTRATEVNHLFIQSIYDGSGYYEFDSTQNFAHLLNNGNFVVYHELGSVSGSGETRQHGQFMPYNTLKPGIANSANPQNLTDILAHPLSDNYPRKYETLYGFNEPDDHYFGMEIEGHFMMTPNGYDAWGHDIVFEFVGDDDFWLYVDGQLVIDLGGIHKALAGSVNYSTGKVIVNGTNTTLYELFGEHYATKNHLELDDPEVTAYLNGVFTTKTINGEICHVFKDYSTHTVRIFYMERGAGASNLRMRFNLATVTPGQVLLSKEITGTDKQDYASVKFPFQIYYDNGEGEQLLQPRQNQATSRWNVVYQNSSEPVEYAASVEIDHVTYTDVFYLKPGQTAEIKMPDDTVTYRIRECGVNTTIYDQVTFNGEDATELKPEGTSETSSYFTSSATREERASVTFSNHVDQSALRTLLITKKLFDEAGNPLSAEQDNTPFQFRLYLGEDLYRQGIYYVRDPDGNYCYYDNSAGGFVSSGESNFENLSPAQRQQAEAQSSPNGAISKIMAGYSVEVRDLLVGTKFSVEERFSDNPLGYDLRTWTEIDGQTYYGYKRVEGSYIIEPGEKPNEGVIRDNSNPHIEVHNQRGWGIRAEKAWSDMDVMMVHDDVWFAVFVDDSLTPLEGTLKKVDANNYTNYYFPSLITDTNFQQYQVREVKVDLSDPNHPVFLGVVAENTEQIEIGGTDNTGQHVDNLYTVSYSQGTATASVSNSPNKIRNIRTDVVTNTRVGGLQIYKTDLNGNALEGAEFEIRQGDTTIGIFSSDGDGLVTTAYLDNGSYTLRETKAPKGYQALVESLSITVNSGNFTIFASDAEAFEYDEEHHQLTVKNIPITLQVVKVDGRGDPLEGAHFALYRQVQGNNGPQKDYRPLFGYEDIVSGSDGILPGVNISLDVKTYYLTETQPPDGYELPDPVKDVCFTIGSTGITIETSSDFTGSIQSERLNVGEANEHIAYTIRIVNTMEVFPAPSGFKSTTKPYVGMLLMGLAIGLVSFLSRRRRKGEETTEEGMSASTDREDSVLRRAPPGEEKMSSDGNPLCRTGPLEMRLHTARGSPSHTEKEEKTGDKWKEALPIMKNLKALGALLLVVVMLMSLTTAAFAAGVDLGDGEDNSTLGVAGEFTDYDASSPNNTGEGSKQTLVNSVNIKKELLSFNATSPTVYAPAFTYTYTVTPATVTGLTVTDAAAKHASNAAVTVPVKAGITTGLVVTGTEAGEAGSATSAVGTLVFTNNTALTSSADGTGEGVNTYDINLDFSGVTFPQTGVYRYEIAETLAGDLTYDGIDVKDGGANTLYLDVYVDGTPAIYGYVCMTENASVDPATTTKTNGFVSDGEGAGADSYYTYDLTISKEVVNDNYAKINIAFPYTVIFNNNGNFTTDYKITETAATGSTGIAPAAGAPTWNGVALVKHGADITYTGIPAGVDVDVYETNISTGVIYSVETSVNSGTPVLDASVTWGTTPADVVAQTNKKDYESTKATVDTTATTAVTEGQTLAITNTLVTISPTGITLRVAPYALMLGIGVLLLVYSRKRKAKVED